MRLIALSIAVLCGTVFASSAPAQSGLEDALRQVLEGSQPPSPAWPVAAGDREHAALLYRENGYHLLWIDGGKPTAAAMFLLQELRRAGDRGLDPQDYPATRLEALLADAVKTSQSDAKPSALFDAGLTLAGLRFLSDLHYGRIDPNTVGHNLTVDRIALDIPATLAHLATAIDVAVALDALEPQFKHYQLLKRQLSRYRELAGDEGINALPPLPAKSLKPGDDYAGAARLLLLLTALGDAVPQPVTTSLPGTTPLPETTQQPVQTFTPYLSAAVKNFQRRHGEKPDGILGAATFAELTRPLSSRVRQIELTMERWRWLPSELVSAPIIVNVPQFRLFAFESTIDSEAQIRQMDVIVGKAFEATQTPVFSADMTYVIFHPYWEVPHSIALKEVVPAARKNLAYLERHQMEIVSGFGNAAEIVPATPENIERIARGTLRVRQKPGPNNSLGLIKFMLPNPYNVYLHGTPAQALFGESRRDFSHGCVRVSDPVALAQYVLRDSPEWTRDKILSAMNGESPLTVNLKTPIRVFIVYGTVLANEQGTILFFDDIYGHDARLEQALAARRARSIAAAAATAAPP